jgi:flavodoxin I
MKAMVIYDSAFGNTEQIAQAIGDGLGSQEEVEILQAGKVNSEQLTGLRLLIVGSPTQRFGPTEGIKNLLKSIPKNGFKGVKVAAFDTRFTTSHIKEIPILPFFVRLFGAKAYAAKSIADGLEKKGGELVVTPEGFYVEGTEGPLQEGELERAADWAKEILGLID